jgi:two-component system, NarL family, sensor kinase
MPLRRDDAARSWALIRLLALPVIFAGERLVAHPEARSAPFRWLLGATAVYALVALAGAFGRGPRLPSALMAALDLVAVAALTYTSGGPSSQVRFAFFLVPVGAAALLRPALTAAASLAAVVAYLAVSLLYPPRPGAGDFELSQALYLAWLGVGAVLLSALLTRRAEAVATLSATRGRLVAQALDAEERERRRLAEALHDEAIQNLLAARQELAAAGDGESDLELVRRGLDQTVGQLRDAMFELHPYVLDHAGLEPALRTVLERAARRGGFRWTAEVQPGAAAGRDGIVFSLVRELVANAARHAQARHVAVRVRREAGELVVEVEDDGHGMDPTRLGAATAGGHIGLASSTERVEALDGRLEIASERGGGTLVRARLPPAATAAAP